MFKYKLLLIASLFVLQAKSQVPGDTVVINTFNYASTTRDTVINFPNNSSISYEKVLMLYNMRCKNGLVSPPFTGQTNIGCGEWDYSCNTYITDSSRVDSIASTRSSHSISNFSGTTYPYITTPFYNLYQYGQTSVTSTVIVSENQFQIGTGSISSSQAMNANHQSGRSQYLFTQAELLASGVTMGNIDGIILTALNNSVVNFLKVQIKHTNVFALNGAAPDTSGFTETYYSNTNMTAGNNRLQFYAPFNWDGVSNIIIDFSYTNSTPSNILNLAATTTSNLSGIYTNDGYYINTAGGVTGKVSTSPFSSINSEITVMFWSRGDAGVSTQNTSILEGVDNALRRQLNIHFPWSDTHVYFDCGHNGSNYDRIDKLATLAEIEQTWNHWAFTKNTATGIMNIYLNGQLWHTGSGKTNPITIDSLILGTNINGSFLFKGDIDELSIWNAELSQTDIQAWMSKSITPSHPNYSNLVAYYPLEEGTGSISNDASINAQVTNFGFTPDWKFTRGDQLNRFFNETFERPNMAFLQGTYVLTSTNVLALDSLAASPNIVKEYSIISNPGTLQSDIYNLTSTNLYWLATYRYLYDGITGSKLDSFIVTPVSTIQITNLPFMNRYPSKYEIMSFVTPYGINLDLGMQGKTWTFDMTDYLPILKGAKRISIERGGEWQENMDIKFLFIVGTPVHEVKDITQLWRQPGNCNYNQIINNIYFEPRTVTIDPTGAAFKIRSMITGHGQEGEFYPRIHSMNINGGSNEFEWTLYKNCASNPVYPQGGTWPANRCGWCPGAPTDLEEFNITPYITPGVPATIDYHMLPIISPPVGDSRYLVTHQLVTYGEMNFTLDAAVTDILAPTKKVEYTREQAICGNPTIQIQNTGSTTLNSLEIQYWINNNTTKSVYHWTGNLAPLEKAEVELSNGILWMNVNTANNEFHVEIKNPNGGADQYSFNNHMRSSFIITDVVPADFIIHHKSNLFAYETSYTLFNEWDSIILSRSGFANNTNYRDTMHLSMGCYKLVVTDIDEDGISYWANSDGNGLIRFLKGDGTLLKTFNPDFGAGFVYNFTIDYPLKYDDLVREDLIKIYPNPSSTLVTVEAKGIEASKVSVTNSIGQRIEVSTMKSTDKLILNTSNISKGMYFINFQLDEVNYTKKIIIE